jgi:glycosyltransferase involved in cell wall biosynthesis
MPKVSVCIPTYRQPEFFRRALVSVLEQKFVDFEIVVTDDSPDDDITTVVREASDPRILFVRNDVRLGPAANWNEGLRLARGEYIKPLHHDDWLADPNALGQFVDLLAEEPRVKFAFSASSAYGPDESLLFVHRPADDRVAEIRRRPKTLLLGNLIGAPSATMHRRSGGVLFDPKLRWVVDIDFYIRVLAGRDGLAYTDRPLVNVTGDAPHQVTREAENNAALELFEWFYLYEKHRRVLPRYRELVFLGGLLEKYGIRSSGQVPAELIPRRALLLLVLALRRLRTGR